MKHLLNEGGQVAQWPSKGSRQLDVLRFLIQHFEWGKVFTEREVNETLCGLHVFNDPALLRRELYMKGFVDRSDDGRSYWRTRRQVAGQWFTERLIVRDALEAEVADLQRVYDACSYIGVWTGAVEVTAQPMLAELRHEILPPNGVPRQHRLQTLRVKKVKDLVGYLVLYHGFPTDDTLWIAVLAIHPDFQGKGYGRELVAALRTEVQELDDYRAMGLSVGVKNWPALRFWIAQDFTRILKLNGDRTHSDTTFADLWLELPLRP